LGESPRGVDCCKGKDQGKKQERLEEHGEVTLQLSRAAIGLLAHGALCVDGRFSQKGDVSYSSRRCCAPAARNPRHCASRQWLPGVS
jgi:hypothetical protein